MLTCRACGIEPLAYLRHLLGELPQRAADADITDLLPLQLHQTRRCLNRCDRLTATNVKLAASMRMEMSA
ncbi:hypothetical protein BA011_32435 (plasmid) [Rhizobium leguminosarum]|uniref:Transposase IS66 C-terminal domain-containing protein n=1 Tax=Rhizobium leguminosarum TaxID=384 RepID=A0A1B1CLQ2_RHILE|nr:hypothetical protein BA011_32435 [Rhizobium leguminosarum]